MPWWQSGTNSDGNVTFYLSRYLRERADELHKRFVEINELYHLGAKDNDFTNWMKVQDDVGKSAASYPEGLSYREWFMEKVRELGLGRE